MENLKTIIELLYKRTSIQKVIKDDIKCDDFNKHEFMRMVTAYVFHYSENESWNLLNYFLDTFQESARRKGRKIERKLNVFEPLFYYAQEFLLIRDNEVLCHYPRLLEWREITTALSEDLLISAFFAGELTHAAMQKRGYAWKTVIGHDNEQLDAVIRRGISENHSHLNGAAPIFHISWLSLMNNINTSKLSQQLRTYDKERRYTSVAYTSEYREISFQEKYLQAALIRLLLYCKICGKRFKFGIYEIRTSLILNYITIPDFTYGNLARVPYLNKDAADHIISRLKDDSKKLRHTLRETILYAIESCIEMPDWYDIWDQNRVLEKLLESNTGNHLLYKNQIIKVMTSNIGVPLSKLFLKLMFLTDKLSLEDIQELFFNKKIFESLWEKRTLDNVKELLQSPCTEDLIREQDYIQSVIDVFKSGEDGYPEGYKNLDYILEHLKPNGSQEDKPNFIFSGERWLIYTMLRKVYLNDNEYFNYFNLFYTYLLIKESIRSELIQSNKNVGFANFEKYQKRKGDLLADSIYKNEFTRLAVSTTLTSKNIQKIELRITPKTDLKKMCSQIQLLDRIILPDDSWKNRMFYTIHFIKSPEKLQKDITYMYCRHYNKRKSLEKEAYVLSGLREKYPYIGKRILGIDAAANEIGCRPEVFAPIFRYLKNHRHRYTTAGDGIKKLPQLSATYHVGEDFLDLADGLRAIDEAILFLNLESGDRLGHALALGIDVKEWYQIKRYRIALPAQDYLDNLVWVFHKIVQYNIRGFENLKGWIQGEYTVLFGQIYRKYMSQGEVTSIFEKSAKKAEGFISNFPEMDMEIFNYYNAWKLRGDDPKLYEAGYFNENYYIERQEDFRVNFHYLKDFKERKIPESALLYYMYHFNGKIREAGAKTMEIHVPANYVEGVAAIQKVMQEEIAKRGIAIETNPSSNYLIGTFRQYEKHPIIRFYNKGLVHEPEKLRECPQLSVSINTDDQGVFSTSLENEYALMARALEDVKDEYGKYVYNKSDIYEWLDRIRIMGNEQSFGWNYE